MFRGRPQALLVQIYVSDTRVLWASQSIPGSDIRVFTMLQERSRARLAQIYVPGSDIRILTMLQGAPGSDIRVLTMFQEGQG